MGRRAPVRACRSALTRAPACGATSPLPTLGQLLARGRRLVVLGERDTGDESWYLDAFYFVQDTPLGPRRHQELRAQPR